MNNRVLIVDDSQAIHDDFRKILPCNPSSDQLNELLFQVIGDEAVDRENASGPERADNQLLQLEHAYQGMEAVEKVRAALEVDQPYALVYTDVRMPPGISGIEAARRMWEVDGNLEIVVVTAYSDHSWRDIVEELGGTDQLQFIRKPFDTTTIKQMTLALTRKWNLHRQVQHHVENLEATVEERTIELRHKVTELEQALREVRQLQGIIPMCMYCNKIRNDSDYWQRVDDYIRRHSVAEVSHGVCPECYSKYVQPQLDELEEEVSSSNIEDCEVG
ncbi:MAG: response regulator transcription factor [Verrucomicrobiota bacterium]